ncbi:MAG: FHA domain-containing protein [Clostridia bacterium]|nr:FHA domain-containing protein [Clostridia bacterium]
MFATKIILLYYSGSTNQQIPVNKPEFTIGRGADCDFTLTGNTNISKKHCVIRYDENKRQSLLVDKQSKNGTKLNGQALVPNQPYPLHGGDMIQIDDRVLTVQHKNY